MASAPVYDHSLVSGKVIDSVICRNQPAQSYALYLPSHYVPDKSYPCIIFFDSHARGALPVYKYKALAEQYGFILIGSNTSKNGTPWPVTNDGIKALMADTKSRINIDGRRIYTSGFSGGSRVASSVAIFDGGVAGVIGCAAGFPNVAEGVSNKFDYFGLVGEYDFNLTEMEQLDNGLEQNGFSHQLLTFNGIHQWPSPSDFQTALLWMQVNAMKEKLQPKDDTLIGSLKKDFNKRIIDARSSHDLIKAHALITGIIKVLEGFADVSAFKKMDDDISKSEDFKKSMGLHAQLQQQELSSQQELQREFTQKDEKWWATKIAELNSKRSARNIEEQQMNKRLVNYLGLVGYMNANHALNVGDIANALTYLKIFKMADPKNSDCSYLMATYYIKKGDQQNALASLNEAATLGYSDVAQLMGDSAFSSIQGSDLFKKVLAKVKENNAAKQ